jgi:hypothetical protein
MKSSPAPTLATRFLNHFGSGPTNDTLIGDLLEEYVSGRSRAWYWRQVLMAILVGSYRDIRVQKLLAFRAVFTGWVLLLVFFRFVFFPLTDFGEWMFVRGIADIRGWWPKGPIPYVAFASVFCACTGWIVARFHRRSMLLMFVVSVTLWNWGWLPVVVSRLVLSPQNPSKWYFYTFLVQSTIALIVMPISLLLGGLLAPTRGTSQSPAQP